MVKKTQKAKVKKPTPKQTLLAKFNKKHVIIGALLLAASITTGVFAFSSILSATEPAPVQHIVRPTDIRQITDLATGPAGWYENSIGTGNVELTDAVADNNSGSARFSVNDLDSSAEIGLHKYLPTYRLADLAIMSYATWQQADNMKAVSLQIGVDFDITDDNTQPQGRLVYEPSRNLSFLGEQVVDGKWQTWIVNSPSAVWYMTELDPVRGSNYCPEANPCNLEKIYSRYPNIGFNTELGNPLFLKTGVEWSNFTGFADIPTIGTVSYQEYWDFEPAAVAPLYPKAKEQCDNDGWMNYGALFKNHGSCVSYVVRYGAL